MNKKSIDQNLCALTKFCLDKIGRFAKTELYFAWKFFKYRTKFNFFSPINSLTPKSLKALRGMCWDLFFLRHQETITSAVPTDGFSVPFMSSLDNKFVELTKACPIRCTLMDLEYDKMHTLYEDEFEFAEDLNAALSDSLKSEITNPIAAKLRAQRPLTTETTIDQEIETLSAELAC